MKQSGVKTVNPYMKLAISIALTLLVGIGAGFTTANAINSWYATINKPFFTPPNWLFAPVWTVLYILMGIAFYYVWKLPETGRRNFAMFLFILQLALNGIWSIIFFKFHKINWALVDIFLLWLLIIFTMYRFTQLSKVGAWLLYPYLLWVSFAAVLNFSIWYLN